MNVNTKMDQLREGIWNMEQKCLAELKPTHTQTDRHWANTEMGRRARECSWSFRGLFHPISPSYHLKAMGYNQKTPLKLLKGTCRVGE